MDTHTVQALLARIEAKDLTTAAHTWRVVLYARALAEHHGLDDDALQTITHAAALHDLGKLDIPDAILQKPARLTPEEFKVIQLHPVTGYERLTNLGVTDPLILGLVRHHHERIDGTGYPDGLASTHIPLPARIFAVIDTFDALTSIRPYRREVGEEAAEHALRILEQDAGTHYCPHCVDLFTSLYRTGKLDYILHYFNDTADLPAFAASDADALVDRAHQN
ncbi:MAG: HD-GYP domain-containing protein [Planctomycetota bacterium]